jgi:hypothetical protein
MLGRTYPLACFTKIVHGFVKYRFVCYVLECTATTTYILVKFTRYVTLRWLSELISRV